jgi:hypothetical protein
VGIRIYNRRSALRKNEPKTPSPFLQREEMLVALKNFKKYEIEGYKGETKEKIEELEKEKYALMEKWMNETFEEEMEELIEEVEKAKKKQKDFQQTLVKKIKEWERIEKEMEDAVVFMATFFEERTFYPHEFVHDLNRLQRKKENLREERRENPLASYEEYETLTNEFNEKIQAFIHLHEQITKVIEHVKEDKKNEKIVHELKHDLYVSLSQMKLKRTKKLLEELKKHTVK